MGAHSALDTSRVGQGFDWVGVVEIQADLNWRLCAD
jgi:hypothetical protein